MQIAALVVVTLLTPSTAGTADAKKGVTREVKPDPPPAKTTPKAITM